MSGPRESATKVDGATGAWDAALFEQYRAATGEHKRRIGSRIILDNTPLIKLLLEQLTRRYRPKPGQRLPPAAKMGGCAGFDKIPWDDAMQAGRIALMKAMESYDPVKSKGRIGVYLAMKFRYELQRLVPSEHFGMCKHSLEIDYTDDHEALDRWSGGECDILTLPEGITSDDMERWQRTGVWPDEMPTPHAQEKSRVQEKPPLPALPALPAVPPGWQRFLGRCIFVPSGRVLLRETYNLYRLDCMFVGDAELARPAFVEALGFKGVRETRVRPGPHAYSVQGLAGVRLSPIALTN